MGLRGVWAGLRREAMAQMEASGGPRRMPWKARGLTRAQRVIKFVEFLPITKGILEGQTLKLLPDQKAFIEELYDDDRDPKVRIAVYSEPRGNGKTGLLSPLCLCHLLGPEAEPRGEIDSAAIDRQMAGLIFNELEAIIMAVPEFQVRVNIQRFIKRIEVLEGDGAGSIYEAMSADARRAHGLAPSLWVYDELAQAKTRTLLDNLSTAMGKRKRSLGIVISTQAPTDDHPLSQLIDAGLSGTDPTILVHLTCAPEEADPFDPAVIRAANPAMGKFLDAGTVMAEAERARLNPNYEMAFRNLRLNQRVESNAEDRIVPANVWKRGAVPHMVVPPYVPAGSRPRAYGGLDLSGSEDLTALVLAVADDERERGYDLVPFFWTPLDRLEGRPPLERDMFRTWINKGYIIGVPGPVIRMDFIVRQLGELAQRYDLEIAYDRWQIKRLEQEMADAGLELPMEPFGQGFVDMSPALDYFVELALTGRLRHAGHPVLTACIANAIVTYDAAGNRKINKGKSNQRAMSRIDGAVAGVMGVGLAQKRLVRAPNMVSNWLGDVVRA